MFQIKKKISRTKLSATIAVIVLIFFFLLYSNISKRLAKKPLSIYNDSKKLPNIILIINDALRSDCLGFNGAQDVSTPNLDRFASRCTNFRNAISQAGWTQPSIASILTGLYPNRHGFFNRHRPYKLKPTVVCLPEVLRSLGYFTAAFVAYNIYNQPYIKRGFLHTSKSNGSKGKETIDQVIQLLDQNKHFPYFILIHILDPHSPYSPTNALTNPDREKLAKLAKGEDANSKTNFFNYKREIEELDEQYGHFFSYLFNTPATIFDKKNDIIIFTADHGEEFPHENGYYHHGRSPYIETMRVPLLLYLYGRTPLTIHLYVENTSICPTILELLGFKQALIEKLYLSTTSLSKFILKPENKKDISYVLSEAIYLDKNLPESLDVHESKSIIRSDGYKLIYDTTTKESILFDLETDPQEKYDLLKLNDSRFQQIAKELFQQLKSRTNLLYDYRQLSEIKQ